MKQQFSRRSGHRVSYVTTGVNNCALTTLWCHENPAVPTLTPVSTKYFSSERYVPPNTQTILQSSFHNDLGLCALLATPVSSVNYILSMIALPTQPQSKLDYTQQHVLLWQKQLASSTWQLFTSSTTNAIVSFSHSGSHLIFGSNERWGIVDTNTGQNVWSLSSRSMPKKPKKARTPIKAAIDAHLFRKEFLFVLQQGGTVLRVYDMSNPSSIGPLAEGNILWTVTPAERQHNQERRFQLVFCGGRLWVTGNYKKDLIQSESTRLLVKLRSRISGDNSPMTLSFISACRYLSLTTLRSLHTWKSLLYIVDGRRLHCWKASTRGGSISTFNFGNQDIVKMHPTQTKLLIWTRDRTCERLRLVPMNGPDSLCIQFSIHHRRLFSPVRSTNSATRERYTVLEINSDSRCVLSVCRKNTSGRDEGHFRTVLLDLYSS